MKIEIDSDVQEVIEFMQSHISATKLVSVAEAIPKIGKLLWDRYPQEQLCAVSLVGDPPTLGRESLPVASESSPYSVGVGGGSVVGVGAST
jgi:hypothetical protein